MRFVQPLISPKLLLAVPVILMIFLCPLRAEEEVDIRADRLEYDESQQYIVATGSVTITWKDRSIQADSIEFWTGREFLVARGKVALAQEQSVMYSDAITYDYRAQKGEVLHASGIFTPWFFATRRIQQLQAKKYEAEDIALTTCDLPEPHYTVRAHRARVTVGKRVTVYNPVFYIGRVPVFYLPIWSQALGSPRYSLEVQPGYNDIDGLILRIIFGYPLSNVSYLKLYCDYYSIRGTGWGAEYSYYKPDRIKGTLYGYYIKEKTTGNEFWTTRLSHWQRLDKLWTTRSDINIINNSALNNLYFASNWGYTNREINSSLSLARQSSRSNLQINLLRTDVYNSTNGNFEPRSITLPGISYTVYSVFPKLPFTNSLNLTFQNLYSNITDYYSQSAVVNTSVRKGYSLFRKRVTFNPSLGISESWTDRTSALDLTDTFVTRYFTDLNFRYYFTSSLFWDIGYSARLRTAVNSLLTDYSANDYGSEINRIYFQNLYTYKRITIRNTTGYDLRTLRNETITDWRQKLSPLLNELTWLPRRSLMVFLREESNLYPHYLRTVQALTNIGETDKTYVSFGGFYQYDRPQDLGINAGFGFWLTNKWKIDYRVSGTALNNFRGFRSNDQEIRLYRDLHCWEFKVAYRQRLNNEEVYFTINLKTSASNRQRIFMPDFQKEFYPWR